MWNQLRDANWRVPYVGGWCLKYVQDAFGTDHPYPSAIDAWNANYGNGNHPGEQPPSKTVPVYFTLGNVPQGHVAISLDDHTVASSTQAGTHPSGYLHPNMQNLIDIYGKYNGGCNYLGWSEYVGTVHVLQLAVVNATDAQITQDYLDILERPVDGGALAHYRNYTNDFVRADLLASNEHKLVLAAHAAAAAQGIADKAAADAEMARVAKATADAATAAQAVQIVARAESDRLAKLASDKVTSDAEIARLKALQDATDAKALKDAQLADAKARADTAAQVASDHSFILRLKNLFQIIIEFFTNLRGK